MKNKIFAHAIVAWCCLAAPTLQAQNANCSDGTVIDANSYSGTVFFNYGSVTNASNSKNRTTASVGELFLGTYFGQQFNGQAGFYSRFLLPPLAPNVIASQGELLDRIQLSWAPEPLGSFPSEGFNIYRDGVFLANVGVNIRNYNDFNVIAGRAYNYEVSGVSAYGNGAFGQAIGFQVPNGTVTGWIRTTSGRPVPDAFVSLTPLQGFSAKFGPTDGAFAMSNKGVTDTLVPLNNGEWTLSFWVKTDSASADAAILAFDPYPLTIRPIVSASGHEGIEVAQTHNSAVLLTGQFPDSIKNDWNHVALTMDADGKGRLYINGVLVEIDDLPPLISADELLIGSRTEATGTWAGYLDELRIYHRRLDELDLGEPMMGTASSQTPGLKYYWKMDEELGVASFDVLKRNKLFFCGASFDADRPDIRTMGKTNQQGYYRIESASYGTGTTFLAEPMKDFYLYRALKFVRSESDYALLPDFSLTPKATLELWVNSAGPDNEQCVLAKKWPGNDFRLLLEPNGNTSDIKFYLNAQEHNFGPLGLGYQHLAFTLDSTTGTVTAYKNGISLGSHAFVGVTGNWSDTTTNWVLGARSSGMAFTDHFGGLVDEFAVYDTIISVDSIVAHAFRARDPQEAGLRVYFNLDEGNGNRLNNSGSVLTPFGTNFGAEWSPLTARQSTTPHIFLPETRQVSITTRQVSGKVAGGLCQKSVITAPPGQGQGTVCVVKVRSTDGCFERQIIIDNQEGDYEFLELPPLENMTVAVVEHSDPDVKSAFQVQGGSTVNLTQNDTIIDFTYFAPPQVIISSGLDPFPGCNPPIIVLDKGEPVTLSVSLIEQYVQILDNMNMVIDDGVCPLDTAGFRFINGIADVVLDTAMSNAVLTYKFRAGEPNPTPPYLKTLQIIGTSLAGRSGSLVVQVVVTGLRTKENTFTTLMPQMPNAILRDPPGDGSHAYLEKGTTMCKSYTISSVVEDGFGGGFELHLGGNVDIINGTPLVGIINNTGVILDENQQFTTTFKKTGDNSFQTCVSNTERITTSDDDQIVGGGAGGDVYIGEAFNLIFGFADMVSFDENACAADVITVLNIDPDTFATVFMYSEYHIINNTMRYLDELLANPGSSTPDQIQQYTQSLALWQDILDQNAELKDEAKFIRNISFDAGASYEFSETYDASNSSVDLSDTTYAVTEALHFGYEFNKFGITGNLAFSQTRSNGYTTGNNSGNSLTVGYVLYDDDSGDAFSVDVALDSFYMTPVFNLKAGQTSCPWEDGTANREEPNLTLAPGSQFTAINVPAHEPAVFKVNLGNLSATNEDLTYGLTAIANSNPNGAVIRINGQPMNNNIVPYLIPYGSSVQATVTIERGPIEYEYDSLQIALVSQCEYERDLTTVVPAEHTSKFTSSIFFGVDFIRPCSEVAVSVPEQNWVVLNDDPIQPGTLRRITVSGYDLNSTDFQLVRVQYRRSDGDGAWLNIPSPGGVFERYNPNWSGFSSLTPAQQANTLGPDFTQFFWETAGIGDGAYEIHAWAVCTGDASDKPGFSDIIKGRIDREPPSIVGVPQPSDGVYHVGDEISFTFNQHVNCDKLIPADLTQLNNVGLYDATTDQLIDISVTCFENKIVIDPTFVNKFYENRILRAELAGIEDLVGNAFNGTKFNKGVWEFYVDRNELAWLTDSLGVTKFEGEPKTGFAAIHNRGGYPVPFTILGAPDWVHIVPNQGTLAANEIRQISFDIDSTLAFGHWSDSITLHTETGQNPFFMGGDEPLPIGVRVVCRPPFGLVNAAQFENTMSMALRVNIEGELSSDPEDIVAAYINDELRGRANVQYIPLLDTFLAFLTIYGGPADMLDPIRLEVWDASECRRYGYVLENFTFQPDNIIGTTNNPQVIHTAGQLLREVPIGDGWNWLSFNLAFPDNSLNAALATLHHPENDLIRSQGPFSVYNAGSWVGALPSLNNISMFIYKADTPDTLRMLGTPIDPATTPIPLNDGWTWIGYVPNYSLPVDVALATVTAQPGDLVKSQTAFAQYTKIVVPPDTIYRWIGNLKYMSPPNGYQLKLTGTGTLTYPPPPSPFAENPVLARGETETPVAHWSVNPIQFEHSSTLIGMLRAKGANATTSDMELGVFVGNEVRGSAQAIYIEPLDAHLFFLTMYANTAGELLRFKLYDDAAGTVYDLSETFFFATGEHQGSIESPVPFELQTTSVGEGFGTALGFEVQPNPFSSETALRFTLPKAEEVMLTISDAQGREVVRRPMSAVAGPNAATWNGRADSGSWLSSGVYLVRLQTEEGSVSRKVVLQRLP
ncbi:MAG: T9SS type A sorting domain-containing protein [Lewinellaceae bacterium]|nr:T9SS type A sorting domain-containing protein [Lewinellaceae bacterium]